MRDFGVVSVDMTEVENTLDRARSRTKFASTDVGLADLFFREDDGSYLHVRLRNRDLYYPQILGDEAVDDFKVNFSQVLCRILNRSPKAAFNPGLEFMISESADVDPADAEFGSEREFTAFTRWLLQIEAASDLVGSSSAPAAGAPAAAPTTPSPSGTRIGEQPRPSGRLLGRPKAD